MLHRKNPFCVKLVIIRGLGHSGSWPTSEPTIEVTVEPTVELTSEYSLGERTGCLDPLDCYRYEQNTVIQNPVKQYTLIH